MPTATLAAPDLRLSHAAPDLVQSEIRAMTAACAAAGGINMAQGVCDTDPPTEVVAAAIAAIHAGHNIYAPMQGIASLREAIAQKLARFNGIDADPASQVLVTSGATGGLHAAVMALLDPGDACIVFEPFYGYHVTTLRSLRITPQVVQLQPVPLASPTWSLDPDRLRAAITPQTRAIILNTPGNPSGKVFTQPELEAVAEVALEHNLFVLTDEMYEHFVYDNQRHRSIATLPGMADRTITISGFSKTFSVTGWRLGYLTASARWLPAMSYFHDLTYVCAPSPLQHGAATGLLQLPQSFYDEMTTEYQTKRDLICGALTRAGLTPHVPTGAYYVLADATRIPGPDARTKARTLLATSGVAAVAGSAFFTSTRGDNLLRFCFAKKDAELTEAAHRLEAYRH